MKTNHRHYILFLFALCAAAASVGVYFILYKTILTQAAQSFQISAELSQESDKKKHEQDLASVYAKSVEDRGKIDSSIVSQAKIVTFIEAVESIESQAGVKLELSNLRTDEAVTDKNPISHLSAHVDVDGSWSNIMRTLLLLQNMPFAAAIDSVKINRTTDLSSVASSPTSSVSGKKGASAPVSSKSPSWNLSADIKVLTAK